MSAYSDYLTDLQRLLHDSANQFWSEPEKISYINRARQRVVRDTGSYRRLITGFIATNVEVFAFGGVSGFNITNAGSGYLAAPSVNITGGGGTGASASSTISGGKVTAINLLTQGTGFTSNPNVAIGAPPPGGVQALASGYVIPSDVFDIVNASFYWGNSRVPLGRMDWTTFNRRLRYYVGYLGQPIAFSVYSQNSVYVGRIPDQPYQIDWDTVRVPPDIVDTTTLEVIPFPYQTPVAYYGAYLAKLKEQSWGEADAFLDQYNKQIIAALNSAFTRTLP